ncbi:hypothetical protein JQ625_27215 [Bradyrhizobium diazoefficiens]|nr:hypothetical protein [Bradyrhizobium diazoefficiens]MBR0778539.1 hypothetical protein [Bradyrhizobium diazoefficiens]
MYVALPDKRKLGLGKPLVLDFAREVLPDDFDDVRDAFSRRGAYPKFKALLARRGAIDRWHAFRSEGDGTGSARLVRAAFDRDCGVKWRSLGESIRCANSIVCIHKHDERHENGALRTLGFSADAQT